MKKFDVEITETLQRKVSVEAASQEDAERMVTQAWNNQDYVLDSGDFTGVDFKTVGEHELAETRTMEVLLVQPNAYPKKISVGTELEDLQAMVGGDIEVTYPFEDEVAIILNESGKINGLPLNRAIYTEDGDMQDIYAGDFLVVGLTEDDFGSLTSEQMQKFEEQFHQPQMFVRMGRSIMAIFQSDAKSVSDGFADWCVLRSGSAACCVSERQKCQEISSWHGVWLCPVGYAERHRTV